MQRRSWVALCLLFVCLQWLQAGEPRLTLAVKQAPIEKVLLEVERQSGLRISFESSLLLHVRPVTMDVRDATLSLCLYDLFHGYEIDWIITEKYLILKRKGEVFSSGQDTLRLISLQEFVVNADSLRHAATLTDEPGHEILSGGRIRMRVWERGNGETLACGTGAAASVVAAVLNGYCKQDEDITVKLRGGDLIVRYASDGHVTLTGSVRQVYAGTVEF